MLRTIIGIIVGVVVGVVVIGAVEALGHMIYPPPEGMNLKNPEELEAIMHEIPFGAKLAVLIAWGAGILAGGVVARIISQKAPYAAWVVAALLFAGAAVTMVMIPHPAWMAVGAILVTLGSGFLANKLTAP